MMPMHLDVLWLAAIALLGPLIMGGVLADLWRSRFRNSFCHLLHFIALAAVLYLWLRFMASFTEYLKTGV